MAIGDPATRRHYSKGMHELGDGLFAYLQPDGSWGWSNAGLVTGAHHSLLVDTLFDLRLTREMLETFAPITTSRPISQLVNTHANGDHCFGNQLVGGAEIIATDACAREMAELPPAALDAMLKADYDDPVVGEFVRRAFSPFRFDDIELTLPTRTFSGRLTIEVDGLTLELIEVGPAHTEGDLMVVVPSARTIFTGDILFVQGTPVVWAGPVANWIKACDLICELDVETVVPGHGPITDKDGARVVKAYLEFVTAEATARHDAGMSALDAATDIELGEFAELGDAERLAVNVHAVYRDLDPGYQLPPVPQLIAEMARLV